jgi:N6-adenosine-specific RNA methylase IME4
MKRARHKASHWAARISASWRRSAQAIIETGRLIAAAKKDLEFGRFTAMISSDLPFTARTAQMLMAISSDPRLTNPKHVSLLPPHWGTMYELTKLTDEQFSEKLKKGEIHADMERQDITGEIKAERRRQAESKLAQVHLALPDKKYGVIYADPEWDFETYSRDTGMDRHASNHYPTSATEKISERDVPSIAAKDSVLFLWATAPMFPQALKVTEAWGFVYKSHCIWVKHRIGTGYWFRNKHETLLVATRGEKLPAPAMGTQWPSVIEADSGRHSAKPDRFYELIEQYFPNLAKIELNARKARKGWDAWGLEAPAAPLPPHDPKTGEILESGAAA